MRRRITCLLLVLFIWPGISVAAAQSGLDPAELEGLERAVGRFYMGPTTTSESTVTSVYNENGTPIAEHRTEPTPASTPAPAEGRGTVMLALSVMDLDTDQHAESALNSSRSWSPETR